MGAYEWCIRLELASSFQSRLLTMRWQLLVTLPVNSCTILVCGIASSGSLSCRRIEGLCMSHPGRNSELYEWEFQTARDTIATPHLAVVALVDVGAQNFLRGSEDAGGSLVLVERGAWCAGCVRRRKLRICRDGCLEAQHRASLPL